MSMIYKKSTGEFWERDRHAPTFLDEAGNLLPDFIRIDRDYLKTTPLPNCHKKYWKPNISGDKILEKTVLEKQTVDDAEAVVIEKSKWSQIRSQRDKKLLDSDWTQFDDAPLADLKKSEWSDYRTELRDLPQAFENADDVFWPDEPTN